MTEIYTGQPSLDDLTETVAGFRIGILIERAFTPPTMSSQTQ